MVQPSQVGNLNVEVLRFSAIEYVEAVLAVGADHPSGMFEAVTNYVMVENPSENITQAMEAYRNQQEEDGWGSDLTLQALSYRYNVQVRLYDTLTDADVNASRPRTAPVVHVFGPNNASCTGHVLASQNHFDPLVLGEGTIRLKLTRPIDNVLRSFAAHVTDTVSEELADDHLDTEFDNMTCDQHAQAFFRPHTKRKRNPKHVVVTVSFARREHDLADSEIAAFGEWLRANQSRFLGACASTERGGREARLHVQAAMHLDMVVTDDSAKHLRAWLHKHLKLRESEGHVVFVNIHPVTKTSRVTWEAQAGYTRKDQGQPHYRVVHQHGETDEWFRNALYEYETTAAAAPFFKRTDIKPKNIARLMMEFERRELWPGGLFMSGAQVLRMMMLTGKFSLSSDFVTFAKGINIVSLEAIRFVEYSVFTGQEVEVPAIQAVLQSHNQTGSGLRHNDNLVDSSVGQLFDTYGARDVHYDTRTLAGLRSQVRQNRAVLRGERDDVAERASHSCATESDATPPSASSAD